MPRLVPPDGSPYAKLVIVGARPGRDETFSGRPFTGASGELLFRLLSIPRDDCYVTNVRKDWSAEHQVPTMKEIEEALPELRTELERTTANVILVLGGEALYALTGKRGIDNHRGSILESTLLPGRKVVAAWHPANILRTYERVYTLDMDLRRAVEQAQFPEIRRKKRTFITDPTLDEWVDFCERQPDEIVVDVETPRHNLDTVYCVGVGSDPTEIMCLPLVGGSLNPRDRVHAVRALDHLLRSRAVCGQNIGFDVWRLERIGFQIPRIGFDTMLSHHLLWPEAGLKRKDDQGKESFSGGHGLDFLCSVYTEEPYYKDKGEGWHDDPQTGPKWYQLWEYNCLDVAVTIEAKDGLKEELREFGQEQYFYENVMSLIRPVWKMQNKGLAVDFARLDKIKKRLLLETRVLQERFNREVGFECNVKSPNDLRYLIYTKLGMPIKKRTAKGGGASTDEETLRSLAYGSHNAPVFKQILDIRERRTLVSSFLNLEATGAGRYTASYLIHGTDSGRLSSRSGKDLDGRGGPQLQNIPKKLRSIFRAAKGKVLIQADLRRAEAMFVAYDAQDEDLIAVFNDPKRDNYKELASEFLGIPIEQISKDSVERDCFKVVCHSSNYLVGPKRMIAILRLKGIDIEDVSIRGIYSPLRKAEYLIESYLGKYKGLKPWQRRIREEGFATRTLYDAFGRRRFFMGRKDDSLHRVMCSFRPQATIVGVANKALRTLDGMGHDVVAQVHDSVVSEILEDQVEQGCMDFREAFNIPITLHGRTFVIPIDLQIGPNWGEMEDVAT